MGDLLTLLSLFLSSSIVVPLDCNATSCGSVAWITTNPKYKDYFVKGYCGADGTPLTSFTAAKCFCPSPDLISPCTCADSTSYPGTVDIVCTGNTIADSRMQQIISNIPATTPIGKLDLSSTGITQVPPGLTKFKTISELSVAGDAIDIIRTGEMSLTSPTLMKLDLSACNLLVTIEDDSLPRK